MSESMRRALRTLLQALSGGLVTSIVDLFVIELTDPQVMALGAIITVIVSMAQNFLEEAAGYALLYPGGKKPKVTKKERKSK